MPFNYKNIVGATLAVAQNNRAGACKTCPYGCPKDRAGARPAPAVNNAMTLNLK